MWRAATCSSLRASTAPIRRVCRSPRWYGSSATRPTRSRACWRSRSPASSAAATRCCFRPARARPTTPTLPPTGRARKRGAHASHPPMTPDRPQHILMPRRVGMATGWALGLLVDAGNGVLLGQHALAYSALAFAAIGLSRRILWLDLWGQMLHVLLLLEGVQAVGLGGRLGAGA